MFLSSFPTAAAFQQGKIPPTPFPGGPPPGESISAELTVLQTPALNSYDRERQYADSLLSGIIEINLY